MQQKNLQCIFVGDVFRSVILHNCNVHTQPRATTGLLYLYTQNKAGNKGRHDLQLNTQHMLIIGFIYFLSFLTRVQTHLNVLSYSITASQSHTRSCQVKLDEIDLMMAEQGENECLSPALCHLRGSQAPDGTWNKEMGEVCSGLNKRG